MNEESKQVECSNCGAGVNEEDRVCLGCVYVFGKAVKRNLSGLEAG